MEVCKAYMEAQEVIGDELVRMEEQSSFKKCFSCDKAGCPARFSGFAA